jgi:hypothetical protein
MVPSIAWNYPALFPKIMVLLKFRQDLTYLKQDLQQSDSGTSQAMWHKIQIVQDFTKGLLKIDSQQPKCFMNADCQKARNSEYLLNVNKTKQKDKLNSGSVVIIWSAIGSRFCFSATSITCEILTFTKKTSYCHHEKILHMIHYNKFPFTKLQHKLPCSQKPSSNSCYQSNTSNTNLPPLFFISSNE